MAIPNINKILEAQAAQREQTGESSSDNSSDEAMEILKLIFEYMKQSNKQIYERLNAIYEQEEEIKKAIEELRSGNENE